MQKLYLIGGSPRTGKSALTKLMLAEKQIPYLSTDALRFGLRSALLNEPYISIDELEFVGQATYRRPGQPDSYTNKFAKKLHEDALAWDAALGFIDYYDRRDESFLLEGMIITPERVHDLKLNHLELRAVFLGFGDVSHLETILEHARTNSTDWVNVWIKEKGGDLAHVNAWITQEVQRNKVVSSLCNEYGFKHIYITSGTFTAQLKVAKEYLLDE